MTITVNGQAQTLASPVDVASLVRHLGHDPDKAGTAVARNGDVVPRAQWSLTVLADGDTVEVLRAAAGG